MKKDQVVKDANEVRPEVEQLEQDSTTAEAPLEPVEETTRLQTELDGKQQEVDELQQRYLRLAADFDNFRRRTRQEIDEIRRSASRRVLCELLPLLDNFELALDSAHSTIPEKVIAGIEMVYRQLANILTQEGVQPLIVVGQPFDPACHDAFEQVETEEYPDGTVISEGQKGYMLGGKVLRPALVRVAMSCQPEEQRDLNLDTSEKENDSNE